MAQNRVGEPRRHGYDGLDDMLRDVPREWEDRVIAVRKRVDQSFEGAPGTALLEAAQLHATAVHMLERVDSIEGRPAIEAFERVTRHVLELARDRAFPPR